MSLRSWCFSSSSFEAELEMRRILFQVIFFFFSFLFNVHFGETERRKQDRARVKNEQRCKLLVTGDEPQSLNPGALGHRSPTSRLHLLYQPPPPPPPPPPWSVTGFLHLTQGGSPEPGLAPVIVSPLSGCDASHGCAALMKAEADFHYHIKYVS